MEIADITLAKYISSFRNQEASNIEANEPVFIHPSSAIHIKARILNACAIGANVANGLQFLHAEGYVHRDLKPSNGKFSLDSCYNGPVVYCRRDNSWKLIDFGLTSEATSQRGCTTVAAQGTPAYRAPELLREKARKPRSLTKSIYGTSGPSFTS
jgi:serine/threonine protein kinase